MVPMVPEGEGGRGGVGGKGISRILFQISNAHISRTVRDNPINMVLKSMVNKVALSIETSFRALWQHKTEIKCQGSEMMSFCTKGHLARLPNP